ncbi:helix-hairpin-helix domain-containing protein [Bacteroidota bacterium]
MINQLRKTISDYFGFNRTETNGLILIFILMFILIFIPYLFRIINSSESQINADDKRLLDSLVASLEQFNTTTESKLIKLSDPKSLFHFDPNTSSVDELEMLGLDKQIANRIIKYRQAGGSYKIKNDLQKIFGLTKDTFDQLYPFIDLPEKIPVKDNITIKHQDRTLKKRVESEINIKPLKIDLNLTDTTELKRIRGIGSALSARIVKYGDILGGYVSVEQLDDVYGLKGIALEQVKSSAYVTEEFEPIRLKINFADWYTLVRHPYIEKGLANKLIAVRSNHGPYREINDLFTIKDISDSLVLKLEPYIEF